MNISVSGSSGSSRSPSLSASARPFTRPSGSDWRRLCASLDPARLEPVRLRRGSGVAKGLLVRPWEPEGVKELEGSGRMASSPKGSSFRESRGRRLAERFLEPFLVSLVGFSSMKPRRELSKPHALKPPVTVSRFLGFAFKASFAFTPFKGPQRLACEGSRAFSLLLRGRQSSEAPSLHSSRLSRACVNLKELEIKFPTPVGLCSPCSQHKQSLTTNGKDPAFSLSAPGREISGQLETTLGIKLYETPLKLHQKHRLISKSLVFNLCGRYFGSMTG